jgi:hypothetical protein
MQAKPLCNAYKVYLKNMFLIGLEGCLEDFRNLGICLKRFEAFCKRFETIQKNRKRKSKRNRKREKGSGATFWPRGRNGPRPTRSQTRKGISSPSFSHRQEDPTRQDPFYL